MSTIASSRSGLHGMPPCYLRSTPAIQTALAGLNSPTTSARRRPARKPTTRCPRPRLPTESWTVTRAGEFPRSRASYAVENSVKTASKTRAERCVVPDSESSYGWQNCSFCQEHPVTHRLQDGRQMMLGDAEIEVQTPKVIYVSTTLTLHYMTVHRYKPPDVFMNALCSRRSEWITGNTKTKWATFPEPRGPDRKARDGGNRSATRSTRKIGDRLRTNCHSQERVAASRVAKKA